MMKHEWNIQWKFQIVQYRGPTFTVSLKVVKDYLRCCDQTWDMLHDTPIRISKKPPSELHNESYEAISQWAVINLHKGMFVKSVVNSVVSLLGKPLHGELINTSTHRNALRVCLQIDSTFNFSKTIKKEVNAGESMHTLKVEYRARPQCCTTCKYFMHWIS